jgi:hypothetical protein
MTHRGDERWQGRSKHIRPSRRPPVDPEAARRWDGDPTARIVYLPLATPAEVAEADRAASRRGRRALIIGAIVASAIWALLTLTAVAIVRMV